MIGNKIDNYFKIQKEIFKHFGYVEDWVSIPIEDSREYYWFLEGEGPGFVRFSETKRKLSDEDAMDYYEDEIWTQRFLPKWVYRSKSLTMVVVDTHTDGNKFLRIFDNSKEQKPISWICEA